jgi:hypothetical protein
MQPEAASRRKLHRVLVLFLAAVVSGFVAVELVKELAALLARETSASRSVSPHATSRQRYLPEAKGGAEANAKAEPKASLAASVTSATSAIPHIHVFGLIHTGTNLIQSVLHDVFPSASICPDTRIHFSTVQNQTCSNHTVQAEKHSLPACVNAWLQEHPLALAVLMVRDPFDNLRSIKRAPYHLRQCFKRNGSWMRERCSVLSRENSWLQREVTFESVVHLWKDYVEGHYRLSTRYGKRVVLVRYEDLVRTPVEAVRRIANTLGVTMDGTLRQSTFETRQKLDTGGRDDDLRDKGETFTPDELRSICNLLRNSSITRQLHYWQKCRSSLGAFREFVDPLA